MNIAIALFINGSLFAAAAFFTLLTAVVATTTKTEETLRKLAAKFGIAALVCLTLAPWIAL